MHHKNSSNVVVVVDVIDVVVWVREERGGGNWIIKKVKLKNFIHFSL